MKIAFKLSKIIQVERRRYYHKDRDKIKGDM